MNLSAIIGSTLAGWLSDGIYRCSVVLSALNSANCPLDRGSSGKSVMINYCCINDSVRCFYCSGTPREWSAGDDPLMEYTR